jgi:hypothetical protein
VEKWKHLDFIACSISKRQFFPSNGTLVTRPIDQSFPSLIQQRKEQYLHDGLLASSEEPPRHHAGISQRIEHQLTNARIGRHISRARRIAARLMSTLRSRADSLLRRAVLRWNAAIQQCTSSRREITSAALNGPPSDDTNPQPIHIETIKGVNEVKRDLSHWIEQNVRPVDKAPTAIALMEMGFERYLSMQGDDSTGLELVKKTFTRTVQRHQRSER